MSTFIEVVNRINDDFLNRPFGAETRRAIKAAIRHYEYRRWEFNETSTALTTSAGQSYLSLPSNFLVLDDLRITINSEDLALNPADAQYIRDMNVTGVTSQPTDYTIYQNRIELALIPDSAYSCPVYYLHSLPALSADTDTNAWITGAMEDVIAYHAAKLMWATVIRNDKEALKFAGLEAGAVKNVTSANEQRRVPGRLKATRF